MAPPSVTPSPHRFVVKERTVRQTPLAQHTPGPSTQQFNATPRFTFPSTPRPTTTQSLPRATPTATRYFTSANKTAKEQDVIESFSDDVLHDVHDSIETEDQEIDEEHLSGYEEDDYKLEESTPKRRRLSLSLEPDVEDDGQKERKEGPQQDDDLLDSLSSSLPLVSSPPPPASRRQITTTGPRFLTSTPAPLSTSHSPQTTFLKPPRFRPPSPTSTTHPPSDPLPEQFSPHRRGQKYVPGGLAAEVRDWLVNIEGTIPATKKKGDDEWLVRIVVEEVSGSSRAGMTLIRGRQIHGFQSDGEGGGGEMVGRAGEVKVILAGEGAGTGLQKGSRVEVGICVGIKGPVWEVVIDGERWGVGVDWKVFP